MEKFTVKCFPHSYTQLEGYKGGCQPYIEDKVHHEKHLYEGKSLDQMRVKCMVNQLE